MKIIIIEDRPRAREYIGDAILKAAEAMGISKVDIEYKDSAEAPETDPETVLYARVKRLAGRVKSLEGGLLEAERLLAQHAPGPEMNGRVAKWKAQVAEMMHKPAPGEEDPNEPEAQRKERDAALEGKPKPRKRPISSILPLLAMMAAAGALDGMADDVCHCEEEPSPEVIDLLTRAGILHPTPTGAVVSVDRKFGEAFASDVTDAIRNNNPVALKVLLVSAGLID